MTEASTNDKVPSSVQEDHTQIAVILNSAHTQKRLEEARIQRAKVLEARNAGKTPSAFRASENISAFKAPGSLQTAAEPGLILPATAALVPPVAQKPHRQPRSYGLVIGLISGLALGSGLMWYSGFRFPGPSAAPDVVVASEATGKDAEQDVISPLPVDPVPPSQSIAAETSQSNQALDRSLADQSPEKPDLGTVSVPQGQDGVSTASTTAPSNADRATSAPRVKPATQGNIATPTEDAPTAPLQRTIAVPDAARATDKPPRIGLLVPNQSAKPVDAVSKSAAARDSGPPQVVLHVSPDLSQAALDDARDTITTSGVKLASTSIAGYTVLQSEVRFFHQSDAVPAARMAQEMRIKVRDFSTYRPAPAAGTLEIWFAQGS